MPSSAPAPLPDGVGASASPPPSFDLAAAGFQAGEHSILRDVTIQARPGERIALIGPSGAGKTTLLRLLNTTLQPTSGAVRVLGAEPSRLAGRALRRLRGRIGTVYQQLHLVPQASVVENVLMGRLATRSVLGVAAAAFRRSHRDAVAAVLSRVGLLARIDERVDRLSGGEQQRVAVARVLHQAPDLVLADEPFASVDPERARAVVELLLEAGAGRTLVVSTHQLEPVLPHFPRVVGLRAGRVLFDKPRSEVGPEDLARLYQPDAATRSPEPRRLFASAEPGPVAEVRVGASTTPGEYVLPRVVRGFRRAHPGVQVRLTVGDTADVVRRLLASELDLAFVGGRAPHPELHYEDLAQDEIVLVAAPPLAEGVAGPLSLADLARLPRVDREPGSSTRAIVERQLEAMGAALDPAAVVLEAGSIAALKQAVVAGVGAGFASRLSVAEEIQDGRLVVLRVQNLEVPRRYFVAWRKDAPPPPAARALVEASRHAAPALALR